MTFEEYVYNKKREEFFEKVLKMEPIAYVKSGDSKGTLRILEDGFVISSADGPLFIGGVVSSNDIDSLSHLYSLDDKNEFKQFVLYLMPKDYRNMDIQV